MTQATDVEAAVMQFPAESRAAARALAAALSGSAATQTATKALATAITASTSATPEAKALAASVLADINSTTLPPDTTPPVVTPPTTTPPPVKTLGVAVSSMRLVPATHAGDGNDLHVKADGSIGFWGHKGDAVEIDFASSAADPVAAITVFYRNGGTATAKRNASKVGSSTMLPVSLPPNGASSWTDPVKAATPFVFPIPAGNFTLRFETTVDGDWVDMGKLMITTTSTLTVR